jgi:2-desacetyl-2-hydroxyethyl bacteriochlorophyllide A dehydrogenase
MKAAVIYGPRDLKVVETAKPEPGPAGILVNVKAAGICGTDVHTYKNGIFKEMSLPIDGGTLIGHEFAGDVVEIGPDVSVPDIKVGDRVAAIDIGAYAEYVRVGPELLGAPLIFKLPDHISYEEGATIEPLAVSACTVRRAQPAEEDIVLMLGAGMIGVGCVQVLRAKYSVKQIIVADISKKRLALAKELGADVTLNAKEENVVDKMLEMTGSASVLFNTKPTAHVDVVIECAGLEVTMQQALQVVKPVTGRIAAVALYEDTPITIDLNDAVTKQNQIIGVFAYEEQDLATAMELISSGKVDRKPLITHRFSLDDAKAAFETQVNTAESFKTFINP